MICPVLGSRFPKTEVVMNHSGDGLAPTLAPTGIKQAKPLPTR
jgi:hypothetical protein